MRKSTLSTGKTVVQFILVLVISGFSFSPGSPNIVHASEQSNPEACGQLLADAEARFLSTMALDGSVPATPESEAAALEYIRVSKLCSAKNSTTVDADPLYATALAGLLHNDVGEAATRDGAIQLAVPSNDDFDSPTSFVGIPYSNSMNATDATKFNDDPDAIGPCSTASGYQILNRGNQTVWYKYTPTETQPVSLDTNGSTYDTIVAVWTGTRGNLTLVTCNDDTYEGIQSELFFSGTAGVPYYIEIGSFNGYEGATPLSPSPNASLQLHVHIPNTEVIIGNNLTGSYFLPGTQSMRRTYISVNNGAVKVINTKGNNTFASQRVIFSKKSYSEMMGMPIEQLTNEYFFPYYDNVTASSQLRVSNLGNVQTTIKVYLAGALIDSFPLGAGQAERTNYDGQINGPLRVTSSATDILATVRVLYGGKSYSEMMGLPVELLTNEYLFPYYNNVAMSSELRVSNMGNVQTTITVSLAGSPIDSFPLGAGKVKKKSYLNKNSGPLRVTSSSTDITTTIRVLYLGASYSEMMGLPVEQLSKEYWYPVYDNLTANSQLRVSNVGTGTTHITVYLAGDPIDSYDLGAGQAERKNYPYNAGPLRVVSSTQPILSTVRMLYTTASFSSLYEMMGLSNTQLSSEYFFPWYNNVAMNSELRFAVP